MTNYGARYEIFPSKNGKDWRFRLVSANNEQVGRDSEEYPDYSHAERGAKDHQFTAAHATIVRVDE